MFKKVLFSSLVLALATAYLPLAPAGAQETPPADQVRFVMDVRWGNVQGEPKAVGRQDFDGSISTTVGHVGLIRPLRFEHHDDSKDRITSRQDPVSWTSWILGHWDGVRVGVSAPNNATITFRSAAGSVERRARDLASINEPIVQGLGNGREIVIKSRPYQARHFGLRVYWGDPTKLENDKARVKERIKARPNSAALGADQIVLGDLTVEAAPAKARDKERSDRLLDFSGSLATGGGATMSVKKALKFEERQGDEVASRTDTSVAWHSFIAGGIDGILIRPHFEKGVARDDTLTVTFSELDWSQEFSLPKLFVNRVTKERIMVGDKSYVLVLEVARRPHGALMRDKRNGRVHRLEDEELKPVLSPAVFDANELNWAEVETVSSEEIDEYVMGDPLEMPDGVLVRSFSHPAVYVATEGCVRPFLNEQAFKRLGFSFDRVTWLPDGDVRAFPVCGMVTEDSPHPNGALLRAKGTAGVYQIRGGRKHPIRSREVFETHRLSFANVLEVDPNILPGYVESADLEPAEGALVQVEGSDDVYEVSGGAKRLIVDDETLEARRRSAKKLRKIIKLKARQLEKLDDGEIVAGIE